MEISKSLLKAFKGKSYSQVCNYGNKLFTLSRILNTQPHFSTNAKCYQWNSLDDYDERDFTRSTRYGRNSFSRFNNNYGRDGRHRFNSYRNNNYGNRGRFSREQQFESAGHSRLMRPEWESLNLEPFEKNFYIPSERVENWSEEDLSAFRKKHNMSIIGKNIPLPIENFDDYEFPQYVTNSFAQKNFETPTGIQAQGWPIALSGRDVVGIGKTGSGKTLAFILPALIHISHQRCVGKGEGPIALVVTPTRELTQQINEVVKETCKETKTEAVCIYGGASKLAQAHRMSFGHPIYIATPGRLLDFLQMGVLNLHRCSYLVLDEADRMLDMGFEPQIRRIVQQIRPDRQTLMWSATWPQEIQSLASEFLNEDAIRLTIGETELVANSDIQQHFKFCSMDSKVEELVNVLKEETANKDAKILVFCATKMFVRYLHSQLSRTLREQIGMLHGDCSQLQRDNALRGFRNGALNVLVATDVAARGIDVSDITLVVNADAPKTAEDYVHRIGRTGRAGKKGKSITIMTPEDNNVVPRLISVLQKGNYEVPQELFDISSYQRSSRRRSRY